MQAPARPPRPVCYRPVVCGLALATLEAHLLERLVPLRTARVTARNLPHAEPRLFTTPPARHSILLTNTHKSLTPHHHIHKSHLSEGPRQRGITLVARVCRLRPPRCVSTGPVVVRLAEMANKRERERERGACVSVYMLLYVRRALRPPRCVSTGPVVVRLAVMAFQRERVI